jgi:hypothetical protein
LTDEWLEHYIKIYREKSKTLLHQKASDFVP